jgi:pre-mRNA-processing factor 6
MFLRVMMKSAKLEWALDNLTEALKLLQEALDVFPEYPKLWMMKGQVEEQQDKMDDAYATYNQGVSHVLWQERSVWERRFAL